MDPEIIVQNIERYCKEKGVKVTPACQQSGAGRNLIQDIKDKKEISAKRIQLIAKFLGVTTSEILGEQKTAQDHDPIRKEMYEIIENSTELDRRKFLDMMKMYLGWEQQALEDRKKRSPAESETAEVDDGPFFEVGAVLEPGNYVCVSCKQTYFHIRTPEDKLQACPRCNSNYFRKIT